MIHSTCLNGSPGHIDRTGAWAVPGGPRGVWGYQGVETRKVVIARRPICAIISPCCTPKRCYMASNGTQEWSDGDGQPPESRALHLGPSGAGLGADFEASNWRLETVPRVFGRSQWRGVSRALGRSSHHPFGMSTRYPARLLRRPACGTRTRATRGPLL